MVDEIVEEKYINGKIDRNILVLEYVLKVRDGKERSFMFIPSTCNHSTEYKALYTHQELSKYTVSHLFMLCICIS